MVAMTSLIVLDVSTEDCVLHMAEQSESESQSESQSQSESDISTSMNSSPMVAKQDIVANETPALEEAHAVCKSLESTCMAEQDQFTTATEDDDTESYTSSCEDLNLDQEAIMGGQAPTSPLRSSMKPLTYEIPIKKDGRSFYLTHKSLSKQDTKCVRSMSDLNSPDESNPKQFGRSVSFHEVQIRSYGQTVGDNPCVGYGPPISLDWDYEEAEHMALDDYELHRGKRREPRQMMMNYYHRMNLLTYMYGWSKEELEAVDKKVCRDKLKRGITRYFLPAMKLEESVESAARKIKRISQRGTKSPTLGKSPSICLQV
jgi:hypothetical protein